MHKSKRKKRGSNGICDRTRKTKYLTEQDADKGITFIWGSDPTADLKDLHSFRCEHCGFWHIGHRSKFIKAQQNS